MSNRPRHPRDVVIVSAIRTPLCRARKGGLSKVPPSTLLSTALRGCLKSTLPNPTPPSCIQDICVGNVLSPASGAAAMRMAGLESGIPHTASLHVVNRQCSSGLQAVSIIANAIRAGEIEIGIGAGVESMSSHPMKSIPPPDVDWELMKGCGEAMDCLIPMGITSENVSKKFQLKRRELDEFAARSHAKALKARSDGKFREEIVPVGSIVEDDGIRPGTTADKLAKLKPVFDPEHGSTTAGNSSQVTDGAAAVLLMSRIEAERRGVTILGVWRGFAVTGVPPSIMGVGPAFAIPKVLKNAGLSIGDVDVFEINEAFASQALWCVRELGIDEQKLNPNGGAIALGHPLGCTGARQISTILHEMKRRRARIGVVSMCIGTGMGAAAVLEVEDQMAKL